MSTAQRITPPREILAARRRQVGLTQRQLANMCGVKIETIRQYEQGRMGKRSALSSNRLLNIIEQIQIAAGEMRLPLDMRPHIVCPDDFDKPAE